MSHVVERNVYGVAAERYDCNGGDSEAAVERLRDLFVGLYRVQVSEAEREIFQESLVRAI